MLLHKLFAQITNIGTASTYSAKQPFFQKAVAVVVIVILLHIKYCEEWSEEVYVCDKLNIWANAASPHLSLKVVCETLGVFVWCAPEGL